MKKKQMETSLEKAIDAMDVIKNYFAKEGIVFIGAMFVSDGKTSWNTQVYTDATERDVQEATSRWTYHLIDTLECSSRGCDNTDCNCKK